MARIMKGPQPAKKKNRLAMWFWLILSVITVFCIYRVVEQEVKIHQIKQEQAATQKRLDALQKQKAALEKERRQLDDPKHIERIARDDYNMVGPNEVPLFVVNKEKKN